ncbi:hypothetical protein HK405_005421 [Cladochytrium tenue]|nr:hypothetical protein HK405_005421 [Cladochytrium tenue]
MTHSQVVFSFLREIMTTSVLLSLVDLWSDPDCINQALVSYIKGELKQKAEEEDLRRGGVSAGLEFDAAGEFSGPTLQDEVIIISLYDAKILRDDLIGSVMVPIATLKPNKFTKSWFSIDASDHKATTGYAELLLEIMVISIKIGMESDDEDIVSEALLWCSSSKLD